MEYMLFVNEDVTHLYRNNHLLCSPWHSLEHLPTIGFNLLDFQRSKVKVIIKKNKLSKGTPLIMFPFCNEKKRKWMNISLIFICLHLKSILIVKNESFTKKLLLWNHNVVMSKVSVLYNILFAFMTKIECQLVML